MAIDLNVNKYGAKFSAFVDFATTQRDPYPCGGRAALPRGR